MSEPTEADFRMKFDLQNQISLRAEPRLHQANTVSLSSSAKSASVSFSAS